MAETGHLQLLMAGDKQPEGRGGGGGMPTSSCSACSISWGIQSAETGDRESRDFGNNSASSF